MRRLVVTVLVLTGLLLAADYGAAALAESAVSQQMRQQLGLADDPDVRINGFPFLTQAVAGEYGSVDVGARGLSVGELREVEVRAQLRDVEAPLSELLSSGPTTLLVDEVEGMVRIRPRDLERLLPGIDRIRIDTVDEESLADFVEDGADPSVTQLDPDSAVQLVGEAAVLDQEIDIAVIAVLQVVEGQIRIVPRDVRLGDPDATPLPGPVQNTLGELFTIRVDPGALPLEVTPTQVRARNGALEITGTAEDLVLGTGGSTAS